jgi:hypothetical protein
LPAIRETVRYGGATEAERRVAFQADLEARAWDGWMVAAQSTRPATSGSGDELVITYTREDEPEGAAASAAPAEPARPARSRRFLGRAPRPAPEPVAPADPVAPARLARPDPVPAETGEPISWAQSAAVDEEEASARLAAVRPGWQAPGPLAVLTIPGPFEPPSLRLIRRVMTFGTLLAWMLLASVMPGTLPAPASEYPLLAVSGLLEALTIFGVAWYILRWQTIMWVFRVVASLGLFIFGCQILLLAGSYAMGIAPT